MYFILVPDVLDSQNYSTIMFHVIYINVNRKIAFCSDLHIPYCENMITIVSVLRQKIQEDDSMKIMLTSITYLDMCMFRSGA